MMSGMFVVPKPYQSSTKATGEVSASPVNTYLARLGIGSRRGMHGALNTVASFLLGRPAEAKELDWASVRYNQTSAVRGWLVQKYAPATANRILAALRGVIGECWRIGLITFEDCKRAGDIATIRAEATPKGRALTSDELRKLFEACAADKTIAGTRDAALLAILYGLGLRRSELVNLNYANYDHEGVISIQGKGGKPRSGYVMGRVEEGLNSWAGVRGNWDGPLFCPLTKSGSLSRRRMTPEGLASIFRKRAEEAGIEAFSLHDLRRTFITDLLSAGADLSIVQKLAGHRQLSTTLIYDRRGEGAKVAAAKLLVIPSK
jgi:site-specific recombinase XerD